MAESRQCGRCGVQTMDVVRAEYAQILDYKKRNAQQFLPQGSPLCAECKKSDKVYRSNQLNKELTESGFW